MSVAQIIVANKEELEQYIKDGLRIEYGLETARKVEINLDKDSNSISIKPPKFEQNIFIKALLSENETNVLIRMLERQYFCYSFKLMVKDSNSIYIIREYVL